MRKELNEKSDKTIRKVLNRLAEKGYITKRQVNNPNGQFGGMDIEFTDKAFSIAEGKNTDAAKQRDKNTDTVAQRTNDDGDDTVPEAAPGNKIWSYLQRKRLGYVAVRSDNR